MQKRNADFRFKKGHQLRLCINPLLARQPMLQGATGNADFLCDRSLALPFPLVELGLKLCGLIRRLDSLCFFCSIVLF